MGKYTHYYRDSVKATIAKRWHLLNIGAWLAAPLLFVVLVGLLPSHAGAASYTWDGGGTTNNWSDCTNWSSNICPTSGDNVTFNNTSTKDSVVDASFGGSVTTMTIASTYSGTVSLSRSLSTSAFSQAGGTFTAGANNVTLGGAVTLSGGTFNASSGTTQMNNALTVSGGFVFNANGGTVAFGGANNTTLSCNNITFNLVTFINTSANVKTVSSNCSMPLGANPSLTGSVTLAGTFTGSGTITAAQTFRLNTGYALTGFSGITSTGTFTVAGTANLSSLTSITATVFNLLSTGNMTAPSTLSVGNAFTITSGATFNANGGTVNFNGTAAATLACGGVTFNLVTFTNTGNNAKTVSSDCTLPLGADPTVTGPITVSGGTLSGSGTLSATSGTIWLNSGSTPLSGFTGFDQSSGQLSVGASMNFGSYTTFHTDTLIIFQSITFTAPSGTMRVSGSLQIGSPTTFNANGGTLLLDGTGNISVSCGNVTLNAVTINRGTGTVTVGSDCNLPLGANPTVANGNSGFTMGGTFSGSGTFTKSGIGGFSMASGSAFSGFTGIVTSDLTLGAGTWDMGNYTVMDINGPFVLQAGGNFTAPSGTATFASTFTLNSGTTFNANGGTVTFDGASSAVITCNNATFSNVTIKHSGGTKTVGSDCNLPLGANPSIGIGSGNRVTLNGTLSGSGMLTVGTGTANATEITLNSGGALNGFSGLTATNTVTVNGTYSFGSYTAFDVTNALTLNSGAVFTAPSSTMTARGNVAFNSGSTFNANGGTVVLAGAGTTACNNSSFALVQIQNASGSRDIGADCSLPLGANPTIGAGGNVKLYGVLSGSGTLSQTTGRLTVESGYAIQGFTSLVLSMLSVDASTTADFSGLSSLSINLTGATTDPGLDIASTATIKLPAGTTSIASQRIANAGVFNPNGGTVVLTGTNQTLIGNLVFYNLTKESSGSTLTVDAGKTVTVSGQLKLQGSTSSPLTLVSSTPGTLWDVNSSGTNNICYVSVSDSNSTGGTLVAYQSISNSANPGWVFLNSGCPGSGGGGGGGGGGEPTSTTTNYIAAQAAAAAASAASGSAGGNVLAAHLPNAGIPRRLSGVLGAIPGGDRAVKAFLRFLLVVVAVCAVAAVLWWFFSARRRGAEPEDDDTIVYHPAGY